MRVRGVTPGRIPPAVIPTPPAPVEKDDGGAAVSPPIGAVVMVTVVRVVQSRLRNAADVAAPTTKTRRSLRIEFVFGDSVYRGRWARIPGLVQVAGALKCIGVVEA